MSDPIAPAGFSGQQVLLPDRRLIPAAPDHPVVGSGAPLESAPSDAQGVQQTPEPAKAKPTEDAKAVLDQAANDLKQYLENLPTNLEFRADAESGLIVFKVVNPVTHEVLRQVPPEQLLALARDIQARLRAQRAGDPPQAGILFDDSQ